MTTAIDDKIPDGYRLDASGKLVPLRLIAAIDLERDALVTTLAREAERKSGDLAEFKRQCFDAVANFVARSAEQYGVMPRGRKGAANKGNMTFYSFDGRFKIQVAVAEHMAFDERLHAAKALIDECIKEWAKNARGEIKVLVQDAFQTDQEGRINTGRVLGLRRLAIDDERWQRAMQAIGDALHVVATKEYLRFYKRVGETDRYEAIPLDVAGL